jgi:hypothetical protein
MQGVLPVGACPTLPACRVLQVRAYPPYPACRVYYQPSLAARCRVTTVWCLTYLDLMQGALQGGALP